MRRGTNGTVQYAEGHVNRRLPLGTRHQKNIAKPLLTFGSGLVLHEKTKKKKKLQLQQTCRCPRWTHMQGPPVTRTVTKHRSRAGSEPWPSSTSGDPATTGERTEARLQGFNRRHPETGRSTTVSFPGHPHDMAFWKTDTATSSWTRQTGNYGIFVGGHVGKPASSRVL